MSDRQLNTLNWHRLRLDPAVNLSQGFTWEFEYTNSLGSGADDTLKMVTGSKPVAMWSIAVSTDGTRGAAFELFIGGDLQGGQPVQGFPINHDRFEVSPFTTIEDSSFINTPGTKIGEHVLDGNGYTAGVGVRSAMLVLAPSETYYITVTNLHNQVADVRVDLSAGAIEQRPQGL